MLVFSKLFESANDDECLIFIVYQTAFSIQKKIYSRKKKLFREKRSTGLND